MEYRIGMTVVIMDGRTIYITGYDKKTGKFKGFDIEENNPQKEIVFTTSDIVMKI